MVVCRSLASSRSPFVGAVLLTAAACSGSESPPAVATPAPAEPLTPGAAPEPAPGTPRAPRGKRVPCTLGADQSCNEDPKVSALWGHCTELGVCECKPGFELAPTGYCKPAK